VPALRPRLSAARLTAVRLTAARLDPTRRLADLPVPALVVAVVAAAAVAGLGTGGLVGAVAGSGADGRSVTAAMAAGAAAARPTTPAASQIDRGTRTDIGYLVGAHQKADGTHVILDRVILKLGRDAQAYARATGKPRPAPGDVLLVNDNPLTRDLVLAPDVRVVGTRSLAVSTSPTEVTLRRLLDTIAAQGRNVLLDLRYDRLGYVVEISERDLP
jgi:hypothetical protein